MHRFHEAVGRGALPFCCQGSENGLAIDGGTTLGHELASQLSVAGWDPDRLFVQVGGLGVTGTRGLAALIVTPMLAATVYFALRSSLTAMPSGSTPVGICVMTLRVGTSMTVTMLSSSFDT